MSQQKMIIDFLLYNISYGREVTCLAYDCKIVGTTDKNVLAEFIF